MVNPAFSESQLKNLRRQNRHLASTHRRKLVFLQASRNPAHGSGRPFFVRDVPVPASFCPAFAPPAPVSAAPQLRPFCRPHRFCPRLPASPARRTELVFVLCALPFRFPARHPGNGPVPASFCPAPVASAFAPPAPVSAAPQLRPFRRPHRFCLRLPASPARRTKFGSVLCTLPFRIPARHPGNGPVRHLSVRPLSLRPSPLRLPFPPLPSSDRSTVLAAPYLRLPAAPVHRTKYGSVLCTLPFRIPTRHAGNGPSGIFLPGPCRFGLRPSGSRFRRSPAPTVLPSLPLLPSSSSLSRTPGRVRFRTVRAAVPHPRRNPGNGPARHLSARPLSLQPSPLRLPFPPLPSSDRSTVLAAPYLRLPAAPVHRTKYGSVLCTLPFRIPTRHAGNGPSGIFLSGLRPYGSRPLPLPSSGRSAVPSASALVFQPLPHAGQSSDSFCARCRSASPPGTPGTVPSQHLSIRPSPLRLPFPQLPSSDRSAVLTASALVFQPLPHAGQSSGPYCARCRSASPPGTPGTVPSDIFLPGLRPSGSRFRRSAVFALSRRGSAPPRGDRPNRLLLRPGTRKGLSDRSQTAPFLSVCYSGTSPNTQFSENWKNSSDGPLHSYSRSRTSPPPSEHAAQRIEKLAGQLRPLPNRAAGRPPSRPGSGGAQQFIAPQQWIT